MNMHVLFNRLHSCGHSSCRCRLTCENVKQALEVICDGDRHAVWAVQAVRIGIQPVQLGYQ